MVENNKPANYFVRTLIGLLCILLTGMVLFRYLKVEPQGDINGGLLALLGLLVVLVLAESFDNFSVGKLVAISRDARKQEAAVDKLEKQNASLLSQLITVSNTQSQRQSSTTVQGDYYAAAPTVQKASEAEVEEKQNNESRALSAIAIEAPARPKISWEKAEKLALKKFLAARNIHPSNVIMDAKLSFQFDGIDPIANMQLIFDGYIKESEHEAFLEFRPERLWFPTYRDRLYVMLSKIHHYRTAKKIDAHLDLVVMKVPGEETRSQWTSPERVLRYFEPAIASGLLRVQEIVFTESEAADCREA